VTWLAFALGVVAAALFASGQGVAGALVTHAASVLDGVDGELARLQLRASPRRALLDGFLDRLADVAIVGGLGLWGLTQGLNPSITLGLAVAASTGSLLSMATKDRIAALNLPRAPERRLGFLLGGRDGRLLLLVLSRHVGSSARRRGGGRWSGSHSARRSRSQRAVSPVRPARPPGPR
jgi:hypothetical protein